MPRPKKKYMQSVAPASMPVAPISSFAPAYLDRVQAAHYLSVTPDSAYRVFKAGVKAGIFQTKKLGRRETVRRIDLDKYWEQLPQHVPQQETAV